MPISFAMLTAAAAEEAEAAALAAVLECLARIPNIMATTAPTIMMSATGRPNLIQLLVRFLTAGVM